MKFFFNILLLLTALISLPVFAEDKINTETMPALDFLNLVRHAPSQETWAKMEGTATHKRKDSRTIKASIRLGIRFTPKRIIAQLVFDQKEIYNLGQTFSPPVATKESLVPDAEHARLSLFGINADDLTLGFIYKNIIREEKTESVKAQHCRVLLMNADHGETARVFISTEYLFPLKVQWFRQIPDSKTEPYRELEIGAVKKEKDYWLISELKIFGPDWRTKIEFDKRSAGSSANNGAPKDLFQEL